MSHKKFKFETIELKANTQPAKKLIVMLHGFGQNAETMRPAAERLHRKIPEADILIVEGFHKIIPDKKTQKRFRIEGGADKNLRSWFNWRIDAKAKASLDVMFNRSVEISFLNKMIDQELEKRNLTPKDLGLFGFSLGGGVSLYASQARTKDQEVGAVVGHSSAFYGALSSPKSKPETLLIFGEADTLIPYRSKKTRNPLKSLFNVYSMSHQNTARSLTKQGIPLTQVIYPKLKHQTSDRSIDSAARFFRQHLKL